MIEDNKRQSRMTKGSSEVGGHHWGECGEVESSDADETSERYMMKLLH